MGHILNKTRHNTNKIITIKTNSSHEKRIRQIKIKSLTAKTSPPQEKQTRHQKQINPFQLNQIRHNGRRFRHIKTNHLHKKIPNNKSKFPTAKTNPSDRKQNRHIKNKLVTTKTNPLHQKQNRHIENKLVTAKQTPRIKNKFVAGKTNFSQQKRIR